MGTGDIPLRSPDRGSPLWGDDAATAPLCSSHLAQAGIATAREHLAAAAFLWGSHEGGTLMPQAYATILRTSVIGSSSALWLLGPSSRRVRSMRALAMAIDELRQAAALEREASQAAPRLAFTTPEIARRQAAGAKEALATLEQARQRWWAVAYPAQPYDAKRVAAETKIVQTDVISEVLARVHAGDPTLAFAGSMYWRLMSGDAHAKLWQKLRRAIQTGERERALKQDGDVVTLRDVTTARTLFPVVANAAHLCKAALDLYDLRSRHPYVHTVPTLAPLDPLIGPGLLPATCSSQAAGGGLGRVDDAPITC